MKHFKKKHQQRDLGFTLLEMMLAITITAIVAGGVYSAYSSQQQIFKKHEQIATLQQNLRAALAIMARDIKQACYDSYEKTDPRIVQASIDQLHFQYDRNDNGHVFNVSSTSSECTNGTAAIPGADNDPYEDISYYLDNSDGNGNCIDSDGQCILYLDTWPDGNPCTGTANTTKYRIADQIESLTFQYFDETGEFVDYDPPEGGTNDLAALDRRRSIRSVLITMVARSNNFSTGDYLTKTASKRIYLRNMEK